MKSLVIIFLINKKGLVAGGSEPAKYGGGRGDRRVIGS